MILTDERIDDLKKGLTSKSDFESTKRQRSSGYQERIEKIKIAQAYLDDPDEKWEVLKKNKLQWRIGKEKPADEKFEDRVWRLFAMMGYGSMNKNRSWTLTFGPQSSDTKQIDIFAVKDDIVVFVECKHSDAPSPLSLRKELDSYAQNIDKLFAAAKELFPGKELKYQFILATENVKLGGPDKERLDKLNGVQLTEENISYFEELLQSIGVAARYQFSGYIYEGEKIAALTSSVPAVKATMGGLDYYSFAIDPKSLLQMSYVLHKNKANKGDMVTYQRLVKAQRLRSVQNFINNEKGFFPNSIIVNIKTENEEPIKFDALQCNAGIQTQLGVLHLPATYKSIQIIDGQHRLLAYAGSPLAESHAIPIVAFVNLDSDMQIKLFMQINQNQKQVDKGLRNTLNAKILYESDILADRIRGMRLRIAEALANDNDSCLRGNVGSGVDDGKITSTAIDLALNMDIFLGRFKKNEMLCEGVFYHGDEDKAFKNFRKFIFISVQYLVENISEVQQPGKDGYILTNRGIYGYFRCIGDVLCLLKEQGESLNKVEDIWVKVAPYLEPLVGFINTKIKNNDKDTIDGLKTIYGGGADTRYMRTFERVIRESCKDFNPDGLDEYWEKFSAQTVDEAKDILNELEEKFRAHIVETLKAEFGSTWFDKRVKLETKKKIANKLMEYNDNYPEHPATNEAMIEFLDIKEIVLNNWSLLHKDFEEAGVTGERSEKLAWIEKLATIKSNISIKPFVDKPTLEYLKQTKEIYIDL